jgi:hypothetical protein
MLYSNNSAFQTFAMIDSGASISFIHQNLALQHQFTTTNQSLNISLADGSIHKSTSAT